MNFALSRLSCACALGRDNAEVYAGWRSGSSSGMVEIEGDIPSRKILFGLVPGELPPVAVADPEFDFRSCRLLELAVANAEGAFEALVEKYGPSRVAVVLGASNTGIDEAEDNVDRWLDEGAKPASFHFSQIELGTPADYLARRIGATGPSYVVSTACSSSTKAFASARRLIESGVVDAAVVGGVDGRCRFAMNGFHALGALSQGLCRPFAEDRDGINLGEGVALFAMERVEAAPDAPVLLSGSGESSDAYHATAPDPEGRGAETAMRAALEDAALPPSAIAYVNLHGTGTLANDSMESAAAARVFGSFDPARMVSTKSMTGHCLGSAGAVEAALCWLGIAHGDFFTALSNSFAFGGSNASVVFTANPIPYIPHRPPMVLLDAVVSFNAATSSVCTAFTARDPWLAPTASIEYMAQTAACLAGMGDRLHDPAAQQRPGLLLGTRRLDLPSAAFEPGRRHFVRATCVFSDSGAASFDCSIAESPDGAPLASAVLNAYRPKDFRAFLTENV